MTECDELLVHQHIGLGRSLLVDVTLLTSETIAVTAGDLHLAAAPEWQALQSSLMKWP
ncbi:MAG: hypothetical protein R3C02_06690 [Planctomycetaceae bacterium]